MLDVRSLAATALGALGAPTGVGDLTDSLRARLSDVVHRCDAGELLTLEALVEEFDTTLLSDSAPAGSPSRPTQTTFPVAAAFPSHANAPEVALPHSRGGGGGTRGPRTRAFGPRPGGFDEAPIETAAPTRPALRHFAAAAAAFLLVSLIGIEVWGNQSLAAAQAPLTEGRLSLVEQFPAAETLQAANARWSTANGSLTITRDGTTTTFAAGAAGDHAAIADWDCNGTDSLGVFRPSTGTWFTFDSWSGNATSHARPLTEPGAGLNTLLVEVDSSGCARPVLNS